MRDVQITIQTHYRWRKEYGGLKLNQAKRLQELARISHHAENVSVFVCWKELGKPCSAGSSGAGFSLWGLVSSTVDVA